MVLLSLIMFMNTFGIDYFRRRWKVASRGIAIVKKYIFHISTLGRGHVEHI